MMNDSFLPAFYEHHQRIKMGKPLPVSHEYLRMENIWMGFYGLGKFETYQFLYAHCISLAHLQEWMIGLKGETQIQASAIAFSQWSLQQNMPTVTASSGHSLLNESQWQSWKEQGFIKISGLVEDHLCDAVVQLIATHLGANLSAPATWYQHHPDWHGLMLQLYQDESIHAIRTSPVIRLLFEELYGTTSLIPNPEKVSFNPPETATWKFSHGRLHWDVDFAHPDPYYIQGLVYLNDVPENRGPLTLVPGFHLQFDEWIKTYPDPHEAQQVMQQAFTGTPVPGKKGDAILWLQTLPHAASANHTDQPRFVQYISFSKC
ncbi:Phytanoyl-CoA dioxygenase (PhyH) [Chitinophaga costaii]|uniref:Phytanoyl-CoA dioxygenase (PhyH) n=1 Tax=Chitinophaga costaii TaxID=1335309 RepID=A0A1C4FY15_9BACT|nr:phytanoyl-CoA dioxygenase family protein [Chitinophaga costaii]PUZ20905.1 hypothetical protein DCM91_17385 [Chitinophaga costaii]SCC60774.1 Phytanoyl-CoA dioxygenase (PhyH) [Chitinophaga costaii]